MTPRERLLAEFERRAARYEPELRRGIIEAFRRLAARMDDAAVERAIKTGDLDAAVRAALPDGEMNRAFYGVRKTARDAMAATANSTIRNTPRLREIGVQFDTLSPTVLEAARTIETGSYGYLQKEMADGLRSAIEAGLEAGKGPRAVARGLTETLGLTRYQEGIIGNFRQALETGDLGKALGYELRDKRLDAIIKKAAESGKPLTPAQIDRMVTAYRQRYKAFNAETHARTTALTAQRVGAQEAWRQSAADLGPDYVVIKQWRATMDSRVRASHAAMNGKTAPLDGKYPNGDKFPGEAEPWNCRCVETYKVQKVAGSTPPVITSTPTPRPRVPRRPRTPTPTPATGTPPAPLESFITGNKPIASNMVAGVDLTGIKPQAVAEIRSGLDAVLTPAGVKIDGIGVQKMRGAAALYTHSTSRMGGEFRTITFAKGHTNKIDNPIEAQRIYSARQAQKIAIAERRLADPSYPKALRPRLEQELELTRIPTRWTVGDVSGRRVFSTAAHEAGHAILFKNKALRAEWAAAVKDIPKREWLRVSEYGATNYDELWAEVTTLRALGRASEVPAEILRAYENIHSKIRALP